MSYKQWRIVGIWLGALISALLYVYVPNFYYVLSSSVFIYVFGKGFAWLMSSEE